MKKSLLLFTLLLLAASLPSLAQDKNRVPVVIRLGKIDAPEVVNGKVTAVYTSRAEILKNKRLISSAANCDVTSYTFSIKADGHNLTGPFEIKGADLTEKLRDKIREWDYPGTQVMIKNIHVSCGSKDHVAYSLFLNYDH